MLGIARLLVELGRLLVELAGLLVELARLHGWCLVMDGARDDAQMVTDGAFAANAGPCA